MIIEAYDKKFEFPDGTPPEQIAVALEGYFNSNMAAQPPEEEQSVFDTISNFFTGDDRKTELSEETSEFTQRKADLLAAGIDPNATIVDLLGNRENLEKFNRGHESKLLSRDFEGLKEGAQDYLARLVTPLTSDDKETSDLQRAVHDNLVRQVDERGNEYLYNPETGHRLIVNKPGLSMRDVVNVGSNVGAFLTGGAPTSIAKSAAKDAVIQTAIETAQGASGGRFSPSEVALAGALGGAGKAAENAIGAGYRMLKGDANKSKEADVVRFAEEQDLPLMTSDVVPPETFVGKNARSLAEKIPITGTGVLRAEQNKARSDLIEQFAQRFGEYSPEDVVSSLERQTARVKRDAGAQRQQVVDSMQEVDVTPKSAIQAIDDEIQRLSKTPSGEMRATADVQTINKLEAYKADLMADKSFDNLEQLRTQFRTDVKGERIVMPNRSEAAMNRIYNAMGKDIDDSIGSTLGKGAQLQWKRANKAYADESIKVKSTRLKSILQKGGLTPEVVNNLIYSNKPSEFKMLYKSLDAKGKRAAQSALISKALEKSKGSPDQFYTQLDDMKLKLGVAFKQEDKKYIDGMMKYLDATRQAAAASVVTPTGQQLFQAAAPGAVIADALNTNFMISGAALGYGALARAYESKPFREAMMRLNMMEKGSTAFEKQLSKISQFLIAFAQSQRQQEEF